MIKGLDGMSAQVSDDWWPKHTISSIPASFFKHFLPCMDLVVSIYCLQVFAGSVNL